MPAWAAGAWATGAWRGTAWADVGVTVPDVVGETQAAGTATLEGDGFVVAVVTAYSSTVPAGTIISQSPGAGAEVPAGSTVTITVSLGEAPVPADEGRPGPDWEDDYRLLKLLRKRFRERKEAREAEAARIQQMLEGPSVEIELQAVETLIERKEERATVVKLAEAVRKADVSGRVKQAAETAFESRSRASLERFERELRNMIDEEDAAIAMLLSLDD
jgi:hypothetical protein